jgi:precorrin-6B methylase 2
MAQTDIRQIAGAITIDTAPRCPAQLAVAFENLHSNVRRTKQRRVRLGDL